MTTTGLLHRLKTRRVLLSTAAAGAAMSLTLLLVGPTETTAAFADDVWATTTGLTAAQFRIESSLFADRDFADGPKDLTGSTNPGTVTFSTPISLTPGATSYAPVYLRVSGSSRLTTVSTSAASRRAGMISNDALWNTYVTYAARAVPITPTTPVCNADIFSAAQGTLLYGSGSANVPLTSDATAATFPVGATLSTTRMVCFRFTLASNVTTGTPAGTNGASVSPVWTFSGAEGV